MATRVTTTRVIAALVLLVLLSPSCARRDERPSFILVSLDTTRADRLGLAGYHRQTTPHLDAFGRRGLVFEQAVTVSENTLVSHASLFTGLYPGAHGANSKKGHSSILYGGYQTLAEDFADAGYQTAGFAGISVWLNRRCGLGQGFEVFTSGYRPAGRIFEEATHWFNTRETERPFFLFLHLFDVHSKFKGHPYSAPWPYEGLYSGWYRGPLTGWADRPVSGSTFLWEVGTGKREITRNDLSYLEARYDEGLSGLDFELNRFLSGLGSLDDIFIVISADHGEEFREHGKMLHTSYFDEIIRIPLLIVPPEVSRPILKAPRRIPDQVNIIDIRPTLLALAGLPAPEECQGVDLLPWLTGDTLDRPSKPAMIRHRGLRHDGYKILYSSGIFQLFDLDSDPREQNDLAGHPAHASTLHEMRTLFFQGIQQDTAIISAHANRPGEADTAVDAKTEKMLRGLGYLK